MHCIVEANVDAIANGNGLISIFDTTLATVALIKTNVVSRITVKASRELSLFPLQLSLDEIARAIISKYV